MIIPDIEGYGFESTPNFTGNMDGIPLGSPGAPAASPAPPCMAGKDSLLHVVLPCVDLLEPGELQPPIGCVA